MKKRNINSRISRKKRRENPIIYICCEGTNKTELNYFKSFDGPYKIIFLNCNETDPISLAKHLIRKCSNSDFDHKKGDAAFCVVDADINSDKNKQLKNANSLLRDKGFNLIVSYPCFELWFLLHYEYTTKQYNSNNSLIAQLRKHIPSYTKSEKNIYNLTINNINTAIINAKKLEKYAGQTLREPLTVNYQPNTYVYKIIEHIRSLSKQ